MPTWTEKEIEDWAAENVHAWHPEVEIPGSEHRTFPSVVGQQVRLPTGQIMDLLLLHREARGVGVLTVVELKREAADDGSLTQLLSYMVTLFDCIWRMRERGELAVDGDRFKVRGILMAPSASDNVMRAIAAQRGDVDFFRVSLDISAQHATTFYTGRDRAMPHLAAEITEAMAGFDTSCEQEVELADAVAASRDEGADV